jgi:hypothetical protein
MRKLAVVGILLASATAAAAQDSSTKTEPTVSGNWFTRMWSFGDKPDVHKTAEPKGGAPSAAEPVAARMAREEAALNRRNAVVTRLREIAFQTQDDGLLRKADELQDRAWQLYLQRTESGETVPAAQKSKGEDR